MLKLKLGLFSVKKVNICDIWPMILNKSAVVNQRASRSEVYYKDLE